MFPQLPHDPNRIITHVAAIFGVVVLVLVAIAATGCAHLPGGSPTPTCDDVLAATARECQYAGSQLFAQPDGIGLAFRFVCPAAATTAHAPILRILGMTDSEKMHTDAVSEGAADYGVCARGDRDWYVVRIEVALDSKHARAELSRIHHN